jgi:hypothetical protein
VDAPVCAQYGQACSATTSCCNGIACTYAADNTPCNGRTGCSCYSPIIVP